MRYRNLLLFAAMTACGNSQILSEAKKSLNPKESPQESDKPKACFSLVNGVETNEMDAVVILETASGYCTGTFVSDNTVITAAHCANASKTGGIKYQKISPTEVIHYGKVSGSSAKVWEDLLVLVFPPGTGKSFVSLHTKAPKPGDRVMLVGYGQTDLIKDNKPDGKKRKGFNKLTEIQDDNTTLVYEAPLNSAGLAPGDQVMAGRGDSGGPVFADGGGLVGIVSRGSLEPKLVEYDVNLFSGESLKLMEASISLGAKISGIENVRALVDPTRQLKGIKPGPSTALANHKNSADAGCQ
jgi:hypothetical protein